MTAPKERPGVPEVYPGMPESPVILHVPHSGTAIPVDVQNGMRLTGDDLADEVITMADLHTDVLAEHAANGCAVRPTLIVNHWSRLVVDPERFPDNREEMNQVGMGAVYTRTRDGRPLRTSGRNLESLMTDYYWPYATAVTRTVTDVLRRVGRAVIIDVHSYAREPLPYELHRDDQRPQVCLGVDEFHTPEHLTAATRHAFQSYDTLVNKPFQGCYIPSLYYQRDPRVQGIMVETRKDTYLPGGVLDVDAVARWAAALTRLVKEVTVGVQTETRAAV